MPLRPFDGGEETIAGLAEGWNARGYRCRRGALSERFRGVAALDGDSCRPCHAPGVSEGNGARAVGGAKRPTLARPPGARACTMNALECSLIRTPSPGRDESQRNNCARAAANPVRFTSRGVSCLRVSLLTSRLLTSELLTSDLLTSAVSNRIRHRFHSFPRVYATRRVTEGRRINTLRRSSRCLSQRDARGLTQNPAVATPVRVRFSLPAPLPSSRKCISVASKCSNPLMRRANKLRSRCFQGARRNRLNAVQRTFFRRISGDREADQKGE